MSNLQSSYTKIFDLLHDIEPMHNFLNQIRKPKLSDKQLIALILAAESAGIDSERYLFKQLPTRLNGLIERSVFNRRRRNLGAIIDKFRQSIVTKLSPASPCYLVDSMPLEICKISRAKRSRVCKEAPSTQPSFGYCAAQKMYYFGYKIHAVCTQAGVFKTFDISPASCHDIHYLNDIKWHLSHCVLVGDKGYLSQQWQQDLFEDRAIKLTTPTRKNQLNGSSFSPNLTKARKRIETLFSQLCDQFMIRRNYAKTFQGFANRVLCKMTALTLIQWFNHQNGDNINHLKIVVA